MSSFELERQFLQFEHESYKSQYEELSKIWSLLESKAQVNAGISGVFLGAIATLYNSNSNFDFWGKCCLSTTVLLLIISIVSALIVLNQKSIEAAPLGTASHQLMDDLHKTIGVDFDQTKFSFFFADLSNSWKTVNQSVDSVNNSKSFWLYISHLSLFASVAFAGITALIKLWN